MRCPKCGYISFDHLENCLKCNKEIKVASESLHGTVFNVTPPSFLKFNASNDSSEDIEIDQQFEEGEIDMDVVDPDLDILLNDDDDNDHLQELATDDDFEINLDDDEDDEISIDFNQFEESEDELSEPESDTESTPDIELKDSFSMDLPDELSDISDLEEPSGEQLAPIKEEVNMELSDDLSDDFSFDLDIDGLDDPEEMSLDTPPSIPEPELSLDDTEHDKLTLESPSEIASDDPTDMDADLNFDLDLGGLSLDDEK